MNLGAATEMYNAINRRNVEAATARRDVNDKAKSHRATQTGLGRCINEHGKQHEQPMINPKTSKPYTKCEPCRATARGQGNAGKRRLASWR